MERVFKEVPEAEGKIDHFAGSGNNFGTTGEASNPVAGVAVVALNGQSMFFADLVLRGWDHLAEALPPVGMIETMGMLYFSPEFFKGRSVTTANHPGDTAALVTSIGLPDPEFLRFFSRKCHISSSSISTMPSST